MGYVRLLVLLISLAIPAVTGCSLLEGGISRPAGARISPSDNTLTRFNSAELRDTLFRYLAGNPRWEIREERGLKYAVRLEPVDGVYKPTLNGFYSTSKAGKVRQTRVLLSFGQPYGFGRDRGNITRVVPGAENVSLIVEGARSGMPGKSSYTIFDGGLIFLEIYDQAPEVKRTFTQTTFNEVSAELRDVLTHRKQIDETGILPITDRYPKPLPTKEAFDIEDGRQPGIYLVTAAVNPIEPGLAYIRAYNVQTGERLSASEVTGRSTRYVGWSRDGNTYFSYGSEITIYEGDWDTSYEARFELWHRSNQGTETQLAEMTRMINGWER